ncbi:hypothetical protein [Salinimonas chungwhensis]|uniref:hypothetical protein n=1 Tax=Salinimonas chungwhensis TaxID=265425 RepID=UPI00037D5E92|nr:hypothetical protein [Salinimonas chungwhensis]
MVTINESYPNIGYVLNRLADIADTKSMAVNGASRFRKEEDFDSRKSLDPALIDKSIRHLFYEPISKVVTESFAHFFCSCISLGLSNYNEIMKRVPMEGVAQDKVVYMLNKHLVVETLASIICEVGTTQMQTRDVPDFYCARNPVKAVIEFYNDNHTLPEHDLKRYFKDTDRTVRKWRSGDELPNIGNLTLLGQWASLSHPAASNDDRETLFLARYIDSFHRKTNYEFVDRLNDAVVWRLEHSGHPQFDFGKTFYNFYINEIRSANLRSLSAEGHEIHQLLKRSTIKPHGSLTEYSTRLAALKDSTEEHNLSSELRYHEEWLQGRILILSGKIDAALEQYVKAVESSLYKSGMNIRFLLKEALAVAAIQRKPHKPTMKRLKSRAITFYPKIIEPHLRGEPVTITKEDLDEWRFWFVLHFPQCGWFEEGREALMVHLQQVGWAELSNKGVPH